jgi:hypothetical protein
VAEKDAFITELKGKRRLRPIELGYF